MTRPAEPAGHEVPAMRPAEPVAWPHGKSAAASFTFDVDAESAVLFGNPAAAASRLSVMSHQAYGPLTGLPRLLRILAEHRVRATFFVPGYTAHRHPGAVRAIADGGHEIAHHGYLHESLAEVDEAAEAEILDRGLAALAEVAGVRPVGYRAPMWELTYDSPRLLAERGFLYDSSLMDADVPYELDAAARRRSSRSPSTGDSTTGSSTATCRTSRGAGSSRTPPRPSRCGGASSRRSAGRAAASCSPTIPSSRDARRGPPPSKD
ncbi:polysaccharide deacetylase family protein [Streptosporangium lutulentum]